MSDNRHVMFAECFRDIRDDELMTEYARVRILSPSTWRTAVMNEVAERQLALAPQEDAAPLSRAIAGR